MLALFRPNDGCNATIRAALHYNFIPEAEELRFAAGLGKNAGHYRIF